MTEARIIKNTGSHYLAITPEGVEIPCKVKGNFRIKGLRTTNPVAVGDIVRLDAAGATAESPAYIVAVEPRKNYIIRRASNLSKEAHIIAANLDQVFLIATLVNPPTSTTFIDRFLATAEAYAVPAVLVINKVDLLAGSADDMQLLEAVEWLYTSIGYDVAVVSAATGEGMENLRRRLAGKITLLSGNSGVGKSTLINALVPGLNLRTAPVSAAHHTGMHTTTFSEMFPVGGADGGWIVDTPGVRGFGTIDFDPAEVAHFFPEIFRDSADCRYNNCTHTHEPGCAVRRALEEQRIAQSRYDSYLSIMDDSEQGKYRK